VSSANIVAYVVGTQNLCPCCAGRTVGCFDGDPHVYIEDIGLVHDENSFDSHEWPKTLTESQVTDSDRCASCGDFLNWFGSHRRRTH
jgi:hypothetical protein